MLDHIDELRESWASWAPSDFTHSKNSWVIQDAGLVKEIQRARERRQGLDVLRGVHIPEHPTEAENLATDLRLLAIEFGTGRDIRRVCAALNMQRALCTRHPANEYLRIEYSLALGNSTLDLSRFGMTAAIGHVLDLCRNLLGEHPGRSELLIGYAFALRNASIAYGERRELDRALETVEAHIALCRANPEMPELREELARTLSNAVTSLLDSGAGGTEGSPLERYVGMLDSLKARHGDSRKVRGAWAVAMRNLGRHSR